jgi:hypothetical protein
VRGGRLRPLAEGGLAEGAELRALVQRLAEEAVEVVLARERREVREERLTDLVARFRRVVQRGAEPVLLERLGVLRPHDEQLALRDLRVDRHRVGQRGLPRVELRLRLRRVRPRQLEGILRDDLAQSRPRPRVVLDAGVARGGRLRRPLGELRRVRAMLGGSVLLRDLEHVVRDRHVDVDLEVPVVLRVRERAERAEHERDRRRPLVARGALHAGDVRGVGLIDDRAGGVGVGAAGLHVVARGRRARGGLLRGEPAGAREERAELRLDVRHVGGGGRSLRRGNRGLAEGGVGERQRADADGKTS